jgi:XTP/dITP diphosphohydrolase
MRLIGNKLVIATHNAGKLREIRALLEPFNIACVGAAELDLPEPDEIGNSFVDNAELRRAPRGPDGLPAFPTVRATSRRSADAGDLLGSLGQESRRPGFPRRNGAVWEAVDACVE